MFRAVSGIVTLAAPAKRNKQLTCLCELQEAMQIKSLPNLLYLSFMYYMKFSSLLPADTV